MDTSIILTTIVVIILVVYLSNRRKKKLEKYSKQFEEIYEENIKTVDTIINELEINKRAESKIKYLLEATGNNELDKGK